MKIFHISISRAGQMYPIGGADYPTHVECEIAADTESEALLKAFEVLGQVYGDTPMPTSPSAFSIDVRELKVVVH